MENKIFEFGKENYEELRDVWEKSVRATHNFLSERDIENIKEKIYYYFENVKIFGMRDENEKIIGFIGISEDKIEMLFVDPKYFKKSIGSKLLKFIVEKMNIFLVDVNEQNKGALEFYKKMGFEVISRDEFDDMGNPFPILHLKLKSK